MLLMKKRCCLARNRHNVVINKLNKDKIRDCTAAIAAVRIATNFYRNPDYIHLATSKCEIHNLDYSTIYARPDVNEDDVMLLKNMKINNIIV